MNKKLEETISIAYRKFRHHHEVECTEQFNIALDEWLAYFLTTGLEVAQPKFKQNRIRRTDNEKPWSIENITIVVGDARKAEIQNQVKRCRERKKTGLTSPKRKSSNEMSFQKEPKQDDDGTTYTTITVAEWLDAVRAAA